MLRDEAGRLAPMEGVPSFPKGGRPDLGIRESGEVDASGLEQLRATGLLQCFPHERHSLTDSSVRVRRGVQELLIIELRGERSRAFDPRGLCGGAEHDEGRKV